MRDPLERRHRALRRLAPRCALCGARCGFVTLEGAVGLFCPDCQLQLVTSSPEDGPSVVRKNIRVGGPDAGQ